MERDSDGPLVWRLRLCQGFCVQPENIKYFRGICVKLLKFAFCCILSISILTSCGSKGRVAQAGQEAPPVDGTSGTSAAASQKEELPSSEPEKTQTNSPDVPPSSAAAESSGELQTDTRREAPKQASQAYAEIVCHLDYAGNMQSQRITDPGTIQEIERLFTGLEESGITLTPNTGGRFFIITIVKDGAQASYRLARDRDANNNYYCKYASADSGSSTGWLKLPDPSAYQYFSGLFGAVEAPLGSPENPYAEEPVAEPGSENSGSDAQWKYDGQSLPDDEPWEPLP